MLGRGGNVCSSGMRISPKAVSYTHLQRITCQHTILHGSSEALLYRRDKFLRNVTTLQFVDRTKYTIPVSYTHLDVYKRQILAAVPPAWNVRSVNCVPGSPIDCAAITPVSYTHLDVYKRQL